MKLSIITINYNNLEGLRKTIDSIVSQTWRDFEWIVVDGGSTDGSRELIEEYAAKGCFSWWCSEPDKGVYNAMNKGIKHAQGEYLNFMNSGDCFHKSTTLEQVFDGKEYDADVLYGDHIFCVGEKEERRKSLISYKLSTLINFGFNHQSCFIKRYLFSVELYDENLRIISDWKMYIKWMLQNKTFVELDLIVCRFDGNGMCNRLLEEMAIEKKCVLNEILSEGIKADLEELDLFRHSYMDFPELVEIEEQIRKRRLFRRLYNLLRRLISFFSK